MLTNIRHLVPDDTEVNKSNKVELCIQRSYILEGTQVINTNTHIRT